MPVWLDVLVLLAMGAGGLGTVYASMHNELAWSLGGLAVALTMGGVAIWSRL